MRAIVSLEREGWDERKYLRKNEIFSLNINTKKVTRLHGH